MQTERSILTRDGTTCTASAQMIDNRGIALDGSIDGQVGAVAGVGDLLVFENSERCLDGLGCGGTSFEKSHPHVSRSARLELVHNKERMRWRVVRNACFEVKLLVLGAVETSTRMNEYGRRKLWLVGQTQHPVESTIGAEGSVCHFRGGFNMMAVAHALTQTIGRALGS